MTLLRFPPDFLWGASTSAHQTEGNNTASDTWALENQPGSPLPERSGDACDSLHRWPDDIEIAAELGFTAYRFSIEWARIEPAAGHVSRAMLQHYRRIVTACMDRGITPVVTLHHFTSPLWLRQMGGWRSPDAPTLFARYTRALLPILDGVRWICTVNEPNMLAMMTGLLANHDTSAPRALPAPDPATVDNLITAHRLARAELAALNDAKIGWTIANQNAQPVDGATQVADAWRELREDQFIRAAVDDDFIGVQAYTRSLIGPAGQIPPDGHTRRTLTGWEFYPDALGEAVRHTADLRPHMPILVTENGIATANDDERIEYIDGALTGLDRAIADGVDVRGYLHWSLLDNYEWGSFRPTFGLVAVDPVTFETHTQAQRPLLCGNRTRSSGLTRRNELCGVRRLATPSP
jgi:beta-glucosidase